MDDTPGNLVALRETMTRDLLDFARIGAGGPGLGLGLYVVREIARAPTAEA